MPLNRALQTAFNAGIEVEEVAEGVLVAGVETAAVVEALPAVATLAAAEIGKDVIEYAGKQALRTTVDVAKELTKYGKDQVHNLYKQYTSRKLEKSADAKLDHYKKVQMGQPVPRTPRVLSQAGRHVLRSGIRKAHRNGGMASLKDPKRHSTICRTIYGSNDFSIAWKFLNPGLSDTFPQLTNMARNFSKWGGRISFEYVPFNNFTKDGGIILSYAADPYQPLPADVINMSQMDHKVEGSIHERVGFTAVDTFKEKDPGDRMFYTRHGALTTGDLKTYDPGILYIGVWGTPTADDGKPLGHLWIHYDIQFDHFKPGDPLWGLMTNTTVADVNRPWGNTADQSLLGDVAFLRLNSSGDVADNGDRLWILDPGFWMVNCKWNFSAMPAGFGTTLLVGECILVEHRYSLNSLANSAQYNALIYVGSQGGFKVVFTGGGTVTDINVLVTQASHDTRLSPI